MQEKGLVYSKNEYDGTTPRVESFWHDHALVFASRLAGSKTPRIGLCFLTPATAHGQFSLF